MISIDYPYVTTLPQVGGPLVLTEKERLHLQYWELARKYMAEYFDRVVNANVLGKSTRKYYLLSIMKNLSFFFDSIYDQRQEDFQMGLGEDRGNAHYYAIYSIEKMKKGLHCLGFNGKFINDVFVLYNLTKTNDETGDGIGYMSIEGDSNIFVIS